MNKYRDIAIGAVVTFVTIFLINSGIEYFTFELGRATIGPPFSIGEQLYQPIDIYNHDTAILDSVKVTVPIDVRPSNLATSAPIEVAEVPGVVGGHGTRLIVSGIEAHRLTRILVPLADAEVADQVELVNSTDVGITLTSPENLRLRSTEILQRALVTTTIYTGFAIVASLFLARYFERLHARLAVLEKKADEAEKLSDVVEVRLKRARVYLLNKVRQYSTELTFWRNVIRKLLIDGNANEGQRGDDIIKLVTETLQTRITTDAKADANVAAKLIGKLTAPPDDFVDDKAELNPNRSSSPSDTDSDQSAE